MAATKPGAIKRFCENVDELAIVTAFDPGGTTGYCVMGVHPDALTGDHPGDLHTQLAVFDYGQIDCGTRHGQTGVGMRRGHDGLNMPGEFLGTLQMINLWEESGGCVVLEDFVLDVGKANQGRDLLLPVRIISGFSTLAQYCFNGLKGHGDQALEHIFIQNRSLAKTTCTDDRLKVWGLYDGHSGPHARDAVRHAFYFLRDRRGSGLDASRKRHIAWPHLFSDPEVHGLAGAQKSRKVGVQRGGERVTGLG